MFMSCTEKSDSDKLKQYYSSINANDAVVGGAPTPGLGGAPQIVAGTPRTTKDGFCGDGIINGATEDCDQGAVQNTSCRDYNGIDGVVTCQPNCLYDISNCMTPRADREIGGIAETCKCYCETNACRGGCQTTTVNGQAVCSYRCQNECTCNCEGNLSAKVESCDFQCACTVDLNGNPDCECSLSECELLTTINKDIGTLITRKNSGL